MDSIFFKRGDTAFWHKEGRGKNNEEETVLVSSACGYVYFSCSHFFRFRCYGYPRSIELEAPERILTDGTSVFFFWTLNFQFLFVFTLRLIFSSTSS